jgi:ABC-type uncharacterized transport system permease subunit
MGVPALEETTEQEVMRASGLMARVWHLLRSILVPVAAVMVAMLIGAIIVSATGGSPIQTYYYLAIGALGNPLNISETLVAATPLALTGLSVAFAFQCGLFNIGAEGQLIMGAIAGTVVGTTLNWPAPWLIIAVLLAGALAGSVWGGIAGALKALTGANEVVTTIMLNYIAIFFSNYLLERAGPLQLEVPGQVPGTGATVSPPLHAGAVLPPLVPGGLYRVHWGIAVPLTCALIYWFILKRTTLGYEIRAVGLSPKAARYAGINVKRNMFLAMAIAGAIAGLAGIVAIQGLFPHQMFDVYNADTTGFDGIGVALLGRNTAIGTLLTAILFGGLDHGGQVMQFGAGTPSNLVSIIQALILFAISAQFVRYLRIRLPSPSRSPETPEVMPSLEKVTDTWETTASDSVINLPEDHSG